MIVKIKPSSNLYEEKDFIFIHIPRTGGVAIEHAFLGKNADQRHRTWQSIYSDEGIEKENHFKFAVVRNTYTRLLSFYRYHAGAWWLKEQHKKIFTEDSISGFRRWAQSGFMSHVEGDHDFSYFEGNNFIRQLPYLTRKNQYNFTQDFDAILNTENLNTEFAAMCFQFDIQLPYKLKKINSSKNNYGLEAYDAETKKLVRKHFEDELETFKYQMP